MHLQRSVCFLIVVGLAGAASAHARNGQDASQPAGGAQQPPAQSQQRPKTSAAGRPTLVIEVTEPGGEPLGDVTVTVTGPVERTGSTNAAGTVRLTNLRAGIYRARFEREGFVAFEREVTLRSSGVTQVDVALTAAPAPPPEPPSPTPAPEPPRPVGEFDATDIPGFVERNFIGRNEPVKITPLGCTGHATSRLVQLRDPLGNQVHADADESLYVVAGEVVLEIEGRAEQVLTAGSFATLPRGTTYGLTRRGRNPPILVSVLSGPPCEAAR